MIDRNRYPKDCRIVLTVPGASEHAIARGVAVAKAYFEFENIHPYVCWAAAAEQASQGKAAKLTDEEKGWAEHWFNGQIVAIVGAIGSPSQYPKGTMMSLQWPGVEVVQQDEYMARTGQKPVH